MTAGRVDPHACVDAAAAVFFDAGGTLFRPHPSPGEIYRRVGIKHGSRANAQDLETAFRNIWAERDRGGHRGGKADSKAEKSFWKDVVRDVFARCGPVTDFEAFFDEVYHEFGSPASWKMYGGALDVLAELKRQGKRIGIVSNWDERLFHLCNGMEIDRHVDFILASTVVGTSKPGARIFEEALSRAGVDAHRSVHVGDSLEDDVLGAHRVGIQPIWLAHSASDTDVSYAQGARVPVARGLTDLLGNTGHARPGRDHAWTCTDTPPSAG